MNRQVILSIVRHALTTAGGALVTGGTLNNDDLSAIVGGLVALVGVVWGILEKRARSNGSAGASPSQD